MTYKVKIWVSIYDSYINTVIFIITLLLSNFKITLYL
jgi:hypothetical protein